MKRLLALLPLALGLAACEEPTLLAAPPADKGFQLSMVQSIRAGGDVERCRYFQLTEDSEIYVRKVESRFGPGIHHAFVFRTKYQEVPAVGAIDCPDGVPVANIESTGILGMLANNTDETFLDFPDGVAMKFPARTVLLLQVHYMNLTGADQDGEVRVNFYTTPKEKVQIEGATLFYDNPIIYVPPMGQSTSEMRCEITQDVTLLGVAQHMHRLGTGYRVNHLSATGANLATLYETQTWTGTKAVSLNRPLAKGTWIQYACDYANPGAKIIANGPRKDDEMCVLTGAYYPKVIETELCASRLYTGFGNVGGKDTLACMLAVPPWSAAYASCVADSCPSIAKAVTDAARCQMQYALEYGGDCAEACRAGTAACNQCCKTKYDALSVATCQ